MIEAINLAFVWDLGSAKQVAGVDMGNMYIRTTTITIFVGLNNGVMTLVS